MWGSTNSDQWKCTMVLYINICIYICVLYGRGQLHTTVQYDNFKPTLHGIMYVPSPLNNLYYTVLNLPTTEIFLGGSTCSLAPAANSICSISSCPYLHKEMYLSLSDKPLTHGFFLHFPLQLEIFNEFFNTTVPFRIGAVLWEEKKYLGGFSMKNKNIYCIRVHCRVYNDFNNLVLPGR